MDFRKEEEFLYISINKQKEERVDKNVKKFTLVTQPGMLIL